MSGYEIYIGSRAEYIGNNVSVLSTNLRTFRERKGLSQSQLAIESGVGEKTVYTAETARNIGMSMQTLLSLGWALELQPSELFGFIQTRPKISTEEYNLILAHRKIFG